MVRGLDIFKKYFEAFPENYVIIGGTACDIIIEGAELVPRATKDIDIILIVEALSADFVKQFWQFIRDGKYERKEKSEDGRQYYRFMKPEDTTFPLQVELFSRTPDTIDLEECAHLTPIPSDDDLSSLSAILMDDDFYHFMIDHSTMEDGLHRANTEALICLKAKAYLEIAERIAKGSKEDKKQLKKHKADVFRMAVTMSKEEVHDLPETIKKQLKTFTDAITDELPDKAIFKEMGLGTISVENIFEQLLTAFQLKV
jgi:NTP pyrophosphatase (non-canonical NTP hydrolase)